MFDFNQFDEDQDLKMAMVKKMHQILKPFLLRRTKSELLQKLPDKIEINISVPLSPLQIDLYS